MPAPTYMSRAEAAQVIPFERARRKSDADIIRAVLKGSDQWVCGSYFYMTYMPTFSQRISELVRAGEPIIRATCDNPDHDHRGSIGMYRWNHQPEQGVLL